MNLIIRGDEIGYISEADDQSFGMFCPVAILSKELQERLGADTDLLTQLTRMGETSLVEHIQQLMRK